MEGERNTSFFHVFTLVRRKRNQIDAIKNVGQWVFEEGEIMNVIKKGFEDLFSSLKDCFPRLVSPFSQWQASLSEADCADLNQPVTDDEISIALRSMKALKAPGPNDHHAGFFLMVLANSGCFSKKGSQKKSSLLRKFQKFE